VSDFFIIKIPRAGLRGVGGRRGRRRRGRALWGGGGGVKAAGV